jgi:gamma-glutamyl:cysteine ligase YbdK (ATP-grasp superfamily)
MKTVASVEPPPMHDPPPLHLFQGYGVELEYMIVGRDDLAVLPVTDKVLFEIAGEYASEVEVGRLAWSNELVLHVIELKTAGPAASLDPLAELFQEHVGKIGRLLEPLAGRLMPTAVHPWMDPAREMRLWPHEYNPVYEAYHRIFDCRGHGWANLQSVHLNLPFAGDEEFGRLHAAIRLLLPIMPALAASSPIAEGRQTGLLDTRLEFYRQNARRIPSITAGVVPEPVFNTADYRREILQRMYDDIRPHDPQGILQHEFLNSRGAIARFDRGAIEIRVLDVQECPRADVAVVAAVSAVLRGLVGERWCSFERQQEFANRPLEKTFLAAIRDADRAAIDDRRYLELFGLERETCLAGELWRHLGQAALDEASRQSPEPSWTAALRTILERGPLARRIVSSLGGDTAPDRVRRIYLELCDCLAEGRMFEGPEGPTHWDRSGDGPLGLQE